MKTITVELHSTFHTKGEVWVFNIICIDHRKINSRECSIKFSLFYLSHRRSKSYQPIMFHGFVTGRHLSPCVDITSDDVVPLSRAPSSGIFSAGLGGVSIGTTLNRAPLNNLKNSLRYRILRPTRRQGFIAGLV